MLRNYLKIALRNLRRHKGYTLINVAGLAVGMACCLIILLFVRDELSYDTYHQKADRIYRVAREWIDEGGEATLRLARISAPIAPALETELPEILQAVRIWGGGGLISYEDQHYSEPRLYFAEADVFDVFTIPLRRGNPETALADPFTVVLTEAAARKYFGAEDPIGKILRLDDEYDLRVTGITENVPRNTHFRFDLLVSFATLEAVFSEEFFTNWSGNNSFATYVLLAEGHNAEALEARFPGFLRSHYDWEGGHENRLFLQPLTDIHLHSHLDDELEPNGDIAYVYLFSAVAFFVLLIACFNFMNLATARSSRRAKEVGLRKVLGAERRQLIGQFMGEALLLALLALFLAGALAELLLPLFNDMAGKDLSLFGKDAGHTLLSLAGLTLVVGALAGSYPALYLSGFRPTAVLKGTGAGQPRGSRFRKVLVVAQFSIAFVLLVSMGVVFNQLRFVQSKNLGFDKEHLVVLPGSGEIIDNFAAVRTRLLAYPKVHSVTASRLVPSDQLVDHIDVTAVVDGEARRFTGMPLLPVDHDFVTTYGIELMAGRTFSKDLASDSTEAFILNETAVRQLGWPSPDEAIGKRFTMEGRSLQRSGYVIGVVEDFHFESLHERIAPLVLFIMPERHRLVTVRVAGDDVPGTLDFLKGQWQAYLPNFPFTYELIDASVEQLYRDEKRLGQIISYFALLAVFVACLGLFGLASFSAQQRTKEIGVRKVLGATVGSIVVLLSKEFTRLVLMAIVLAVPVAYLTLQHWLDTFAYRIALSPWMFIGAGAAALLIALLTVSYQAIKAALADPVKSLRYE